MLFFGGGRAFWESRSLPRLPGTRSLMVVVASGLRSVTVAVETCALHFARLLGGRSEPKLP
eukprot:7018303-Pyramimonas_sp.AAC.1